MYFLIDKTKYNIVLVNILFIHTKKIENVETIKIYKEIIMLYTVKIN